MRFLLVSILLLSFSSLSFIEFNQEENYRFHKVFFYSFTKYVEWPDSSNEGDFKIGVVGESSITDLLKEMAEIKRVNGREIYVQELEPKDLENDWNIVFIPAKYSNRFESVKGKIGGRSILLVTEGDDLGQKGSMINFKDVNGKLKFEVNTARIKANGMKISSALVNLGEQIN